MIEMNIKELLKAYKDLDPMEDPTGINEAFVEKDKLLPDIVTIESDVLGFGISLNPVNKPMDNEEKTIITLVTHGSQAHVIDLPVQEVQDIINKHIKWLEDEIIAKLNGKNN